MNGLNTRALRPVHLTASLRGENSAQTEGEILAEYAGSSLLLRRRDGTHAQTAMPKRLVRCVRMGEKQMNDFRLVFKVSSTTTACAHRATLRAKAAVAQVGQLVVIPWIVVSRTSYYTRASFAFFTNNSRHSK